DRDPRGPLLVERLLEPRDERADDRRLVRGREIRAAPFGLLGSQVAGPVEKRRLQPAEAEVEPAPGERAREVEPLRVAVAREQVEPGAAWVAETQQAGALVEPLARRVVERLPKQLVLRRGIHPGEEGVPAARHERDEGWLDRVISQRARQHVPGQV